MKIIFAPAKEMRIDKLSTDKPLYSATTQAIIQTLQAQSDDQLKKLLTNKCHKSKTICDT